MLSIAVGDVILLFATNSRPPKQKRVILVAKSGDTFLGVFINSELNVNVLSAELQDLHLEFTKNGDRKYLDYTSFVDCNEPYEYSMEEIVKSLKRNLDNHLGSCSSSDLELIQNTVKNSPTLTGYARKQYFPEARRPRKQSS